MKVAGQVLAKGELAKSSRVPNEYPRHVAIAYIVQVYGTAQEMVDSRTIMEQRARDSKEACREEAWLDRPDGCGGTGEALSGGLELAE